MTGDQDNPAGDTGGKVPAETLELRARPQPVTRINRSVLIGAAADRLILRLGPGAGGPETTQPAPWSKS